MKSNREVKEMKINKKDILGKRMNLKVKAGKSEPACMQCLPPAPMKGHKSFYGIPIHTRVDIPDGVLYLINEDLR